MLYLKDPLRNRIEYRLVREPDAVPVAKLLGEVFSQHEPLALAVGQPAGEVEAVVSLYASKVAAEQLAMLAEDPAGGAPLGVAIAHDFGTPVPGGLDHIGESFDQIAALLDQLEASYRARRQVRPGLCAHIFMVGVRPDASGRGIARQLIANVVANAGSRGYQYALTEATSAPSQHVFRQGGFRELHAVPYGTFEYHGRRPFASVLTPPSALLMEREIGHA